MRETKGFDISPFGDWLRAAMKNTAQTAKVGGILAIVAIVSYQLGKRHCGS